MTDLKEVTDNLIQGKASEVKELVQKAVEEGEDVQKVLNGGLVGGMSIVGTRLRRTSSMFRGVNCRSGNEGSSRYCEQLRS